MRVMDVPLVGVKVMMVLLRLMMMMKMTMR